MSDYSTEDIVKYAISGDGSRVKDAIQGVVANKVMTSMETKKAEVAQAMFNSAVKPETVAEPSVETSEVNAEEA